MNFFVDLAWNAYSRPQYFIFWGSEPLNVIGHHRDPQKAHPWPKPHLHAKFCADRSTGATWARAKGIKKKARKETYSGKLGVRPDHPRWRSDMWFCMPGGLREVVLIFKFRQNRLNGFRDLGVEICHFLYLRPVAYITAYTTVQAVIYKCMYVCIITLYINLSPDPLHTRPDHSASSTFRTKSTPCLIGWCVVCINDSW